MSADGIVAVQSFLIKPYNDALEGFKSICNCNVKEFVVSEIEGADIISEIHKAKPEIILAIGIDALERIKNIKDIPIVHMMILNPQSVTSYNKNITGVSLYISPEKQLSFLRKVLPEAKNIGLLYDPARTGDFVEKAKRAATATSIKLFAKEIHKSRDFSALLNGMKGEINAYWMLPDLTVVTPETVELLFLFSIENRIPVITFSNKYLEMGALMSFDIDTRDIGKQAGETANNILSGMDVKNMKMTDARKINININRKTAKKLGITMNERMFGNERLMNQQ